MSEPHAVEPIAPPLPAAATTVASAAGESVVTVASPTVESNASLETKSEPSTQAAEGRRSWLWLTKLDQALVTVFVAVFLVLVGYHWATLGGWGMRPIEIDRLPERQYDFRIDINSASWVEWTQIEGIGEVTAQKIIADREANGPFRKIDDLLRVKGIGPKNLESMRPFLREPNSEGEQSRP